MFFMVGITQGRKDLARAQLVVCPRCGRYGRYLVYMTFSQLLLFFIPCLRWGKRYFVQMSCCGASYELDPEVGARIARGEGVEVRPSDLTPAGGGRIFYGRDGAGRGDMPRMRRCPACGYETGEDFAYCPRCGAQLEEIG